MIGAARAAASLLDKAVLADRGDPNWTIRRKNCLRLVWWAIALVTALALFRDLTAAAPVIGALLAFASTVFGIYVGAVAWEDRDKRRVDAAENAAKREGG